MDADDSENVNFRGRALVAAMVGLALGVLASVLTGCGASNFDGGTADGKQAILDATNIALSSNDCTGAIAKIEGLYNSANSDNDVRMIAGSAYACNAGLNFFHFIGKIAQAGPALGAGALWSFLSNEFPASSSPENKAAASALLASDALMAVLMPGAVILPSDYINKTTYNPGSTTYTDRTNDSNAFLLFVSLAQIGTIENRSGTVAADHSGEFPTTWTDVAPASIDATMATYNYTLNPYPCAFGSAIVNFKDTLASVAASSTGNLATALNSLATITSGFDVACQNGCTACGIICSECPSTLRDRTSCTGVKTDVNSCATMGLVQLVNLTWKTVPAP